ncbi:hypothetical protein BD626DRAFT_512488 [Schizophyllum amplum]|uniref:Zn(2)-C6 fungal-type domain-containing protein n=1 Tax=Schizophyllum amplum TaxID=97359 RepID=A0A550C075_9AGAR|nr:hypothetical protein BD626DRAFT_512488 [Auriculariopsis ampla]
MVPVTFKDNHTGTSAIKKKKKPPACDYCKARRVICHPQPDGKPCPRCVEKEVICTTTPVVRRKPRRRDEGDQARDESPSVPASSATTSTSSASSSRAGEQSRDQTDSPTTSAVLAWQDANHLAGPFVQELIKLFPSLPQSQLPLVPYRQIHDQLERCAWNPAQLAPKERVLAHCIMAVTALVSTHPSLVGADMSDPQFASFLTSASVMTTPGIDLRKLGQRRSALSHRLHQEASRLALEVGITSITTETNAASCYLLEFLEASINPYDNPMSWTAAMIWHTRSLAESDKHSALFGVTFGRLQWPVHLMNIAILSLCAGRSIPFTEHDERLIFGPPPPTLEAATFTLSNQPITAKNLGTFMYSFTCHIIRIARESSENVIGPYARRFPLNEAALINHIAAVDGLQKTSLFLHDCIDIAIPIVVHAWIKSALATACFASATALTGLLVPLHRELKRRLASGSVVVLAEGSGGDFTADAAHRTRCRIELLHRQVRVITLRAIIEATKRARGLPNLPRLTLMQCSRVTAWVQLLVDECDGTGISPVERYDALEKLRDLLKLDGFTWVDHTGSVAAIEAEMALLQGKQQLVPRYMCPHVHPSDLGMQGASASDAAYADERAFIDEHYGDEQAYGERTPFVDNQMYGGPWDSGLATSMLGGPVLASDLAADGIPQMLGDADLDTVLVQPAMALGFRVGPC